MELALTLLVEMVKVVEINSELPRTTMVKIVKLVEMVEMVVWKSRQG